ncbi:sphingomyelinase C-like [Amphiura filiformis]|uniref:sphingomyelinase C-like n=1 Tax=Amphiura filiformis TaxID=82378 RepID=UPI003B2209BE
MLKVLAYNVWELRYLYAQSGQQERTCRIPYEVFKLHPDVDVIVFNEVFMGGCFADDSLTIRDIIHEHGFVHYTGTVGEPVTPRKPENGGVFIASRWPIKVEKQHVYENSQKGTADAVSGKGCMYAQIEKTVDNQNKVYHIFGTHLQAQNGTSIDQVRVLQAGEMHAFMQDQDIPADEPVIYAGDLNADKINNVNHAADILMTLEANLPPIVGELDSTYDTEINDIFFEVDDYVAWLDYALYSDIHVHPTWSALEVVRPRYSEPFPVCMAAINPRHTYPDSELCFISKSIRDLSDHFAVLGVFDYGMEPEPTTKPVIETTSGGQRSFVTSLLTFIIFCLLVSHFL